jgi:hypothetical protein
MESLGGANARIRAGHDQADRSVPFCAEVRSRKRSHFWSHRVASNVDCRRFEEVSRRATLAVRSPAPTRSIPRFEELVTLIWIRADPVVGFD